MLSAALNIEAGKCKMHGKKNDANNYRQSYCFKKSKSFLFQHFLILLSSKRDKML